MNIGIWASNMWVSPGLAMKHGDWTEPSNEWDRTMKQRALTTKGKRTMLRHEKWDWNMTIGIEAWNDGQESNKERERPSRDEIFWLSIAAASLGAHKFTGDAGCSAQRIEAMANSSEGWEDCFQRSQRSSLTSWITVCFRFSGTPFFAVWNQIQWTGCCFSNAWLRSSNEFVGVIWTQHLGRCVHPGRT